MSQSLVNTEPTFRIVIGAESVGDITVTVTNGNGTVVDEDAATTDNEDGTYDYTLFLADNTRIDVLKLIWTLDTGETVTTFEEIVGNLLFTVSSAREFGAKSDATAALKPLASTTEYLTATIAAERVRITEDLEYWTGRAWIPRYARIVFSGNGTTRLQLRKGICRTADGYMLNRPGRFNDTALLLSASIGGTAVTLSNVEIDTVSETLILKSGVWTYATAANPYNITVEYVYGPPYLIDGVDRIALKILIDRLVPSAFPDRALRVEGEYGTMQLVQPGGPMKNVSRVPDVNDWVSRHDHRVLVG
jgi:hypothetical protein